MSSSSSKCVGLQIKQCQRFSLPIAVTQAPPPPCTNAPPSINDIPTSTVTLKMVPLPPPPRGAPPKKKQSLGKQSPFFPGVYSRPLFTLTPVRHFSSIPDGKSIIFNYFRKALPHEMSEGSTYILVDIFENLWTAPEVFLKWQEAVDAGTMKDPEKSAYRYSITRIGNEYRLYWSLKKDSIQAVHHPAPPPFTPLPKANMTNNEDDEEEEEAFPADDSENDPDFLPGKK